MKLYCMYCNKHALACGGSTHHWVLIHRHSGSIWQVIEDIRWLWQKIPAEVMIKGWTIVDDNIKWRYKLTGHLQEKTLTGFSPGQEYTSWFPPVNHTAVYQGDHSGEKEREGTFSFT